MNYFENRYYMIFNLSEINLINFDEVLETNIDTIAKNLDKTKTYVKWEGESIPPSVDLLTTKKGPYTHDEMMDILRTSDWAPIINI